ncbi:Hypothetical predicted protein [Mytilus galloprovincialis]|nr:Hypothetical predicted protein [Mytilus galloprovincialis]
MRKDLGQLKKRYNQAAEDEKPALSELRKPSGRTARSQGEQREQEKGGKRKRKQEFNSH